MSQTGLALFELVRLTDASSPLTFPTMRLLEMGIHYVNLDAMTRGLMLQESKLGGHYISPRLTHEGQINWQMLLEQAIQSYNDDWLGSELIRLHYLDDNELYTRSGVTRTRAINKHQAAEQLAEGEFNRYYLRGLCLRAKSEGKNSLIVYRGKAVREPRPESEAKIGTSVSADLLLDKLRANDFVSIGDALGVPGGPNSGITAKLP